MSEKSRFMQFVLDGVQRKLEPRNALAEDTVQRQIDLVANKDDICTHPAKRYEPLNKNSLSLQDHILKTHAALVFHCDDKIASKIKNLSTQTGNELITEQHAPDGGKTLYVWNEATRTRDEHEEIYASRDPGTGAQFAAYYDLTNQRISINFGGTDFTNPQDLKSAAQTVVGAVDMRMTRVHEDIGRTIENFKEKHPGLIGDMPVDIYAHSSGANGIALAHYFLEREHGITPRAQVMLDPFGAKNSFEKVANMVAKAEGRDKNEVLSGFTTNTLSYKVDSNTFIDKVSFFDKYNHSGPGHADATIGATEKLKIPGNLITAHMGKAWINFFNAAEVTRLDMAEGRSPTPAVTKPAAPSGAKSKTLG